MALGSASQRGELWRRLPKRRAQLTTPGHDYSGDTTRQDGTTTLTRFLWQHRSSPLGEARPGPRGSAGAHLGREVRSRAGEHMAAPELSSQGGRARSHGTCGSTGAHLGREARSRAEERVMAPELNSARRRGTGPRATWEHRSSPQQGGEVRGHGTRGGSRAHLCTEVWSVSTACVAAHGCTSYSLSKLRACMQGYPIFKVPTKTFST
jgi:hypothetical protein